MSAFMEILSKYQYHELFYTNESKSDFAAGCTVHNVSNNIFLLILLIANIILSAELFTIKTMFEMHAIFPKVILHFCTSQPFKIL